METRSIGSLEVSVIGLGTNNFGFFMEEADVAPVLDVALECGINLLDTADSYASSERRLGAVLGSRRDDVVLATKFGSSTDELAGGAAPDYIRSAVERSLTELKTDRIDLYQLHRPDPNTPIAETLGALSDLQAAGKIREVGCSNFSADQLREAAAAGTPAQFVAVQNHYNVLHRDDEAEVIPTCEQLGIAYIPYFPLESGLLTGKYRRGQAAPDGTRLAKWGARGSEMLSDENFDAVDRLAAWAADRNHSLLELAFAWLLAKPCVASIIAGATRPDQVRANAAVEWRLTPAEVAEVDALTARPGHVG
jgi:aryl-alcohol dehydrogenase-like predicted oxidoreductase